MLLGFGAAATAMIAASVGATAAEILVLVCGLLGCAAILLRPFLGVFLLVFLIQIGGLVTAIIGSAGEYAYEGLTALTLVAVILQAPQRERGARWGANSLTFRLAIVFILSLGISVLLSDFPEQASRGLLKMCILLALFFIIISMANTTRRIAALAIALLGSTIVSGFVSLISYVSGSSFLGLNQGERLAGAASTVATTAANMLLVGTAMGLLLALLSKKYRFIGTAAFALGTCGIVFSQTRSALGVLVFALIWLAYRFRKSRHAPAAVLLGILGAVSLLPFVPAKVWDRFADFENPSADWTLGRRWGYQLIGLDLVQKYPVFGVGPGAFGQHYQQYQYRWVEGRRLDTRNLHNVYLSVAAETGLVGLTIFLSILITTWTGLRNVVRGARDPTLARLAESFLLGLTLFLISAVTLPVMDNKLLWTLIAIPAAIITLAKREQESPSTDESPGEARDIELDGRLALKELAYIRNAK